MKKKNNESTGLFITGIAIFALGLFFNYGIVIFLGAALLIAGMLPASKQEDESDSI